MLDVFLIVAVILILYNMWNPESFGDWLAEVRVAYDRSLKEIKKENRNV